MTDPQFTTDLKALADEYQLNIKAKVTPVDPDFEEFDIEATVTPPTTPAVDPSIAPVTPDDSNATPDTTPAS